MIQFVSIFAIVSILSLIGATLFASLIGKMGFPIPPVSRRMGSVDGLRGYLALCVVAHHCFIWIQDTRLGGSWAPPSINFFNQLGAGSVGLFFMTTGFVFYPRILGGFKATSWPSVYITRAFRITPLILFSVLAITIVIFMRTGSFPNTNYPIAAMEWITTIGEPPLLGYSDSGRLNAYVLWSLWYEWLFYIFILPACAAAVDMLRSHGIQTVVLPILLFIIGIGSKVVSKLTGLPVSIFSYLPLFAIGMFAYELRSNPKRQYLLMDWKIGIIAGAALLIAMLAFSTPYSAALPIFGFFFICVSSGNNLLGVLSSKGALVLGECSFGIYLLHGLVLDVIFVEGGPMNGQLPLAVEPILLLIAVGIIILVAPITYLIIERPAIRLGKYIASYFAGNRIKINRQELDIAP